MEWINFWFSRDRWGVADKVMTLRNRCLLKDSAPQSCTAITPRELSSTSRNNPI